MNVAETWLLFVIIAVETVILLIELYILVYLYLELELRNNTANIIASTRILGKQKQAQRGCCRNIYFNINLILVLTLITMIIIFMFLSFRDLKCYWTMSLYIESIMLNVYILVGGFSIIFYYKYLVEVSVSKRQLQEEHLLMFDSIRRSRQDISCSTQSMSIPQAKLYLQGYANRYSKKKSKSSSKSKSEKSSKSAVRSDPLCTNTEEMFVMEQYE